MKYNTGYKGRASCRVSEWEKDQCAKRWASTMPTAKQIALYKRLMYIAVNNQLLPDIAKAGGLILRPSSRAEYSHNISFLSEFLEQRGLYDAKGLGESSQEFARVRDEMREKREREIEQTDWIPMTNRLPDRKYVKTIDKNMTARVLVWDARRACFLDKYDVPVTKNNIQRTGVLPPVAWAYLGDEGIKKSYREDCKQ